LPDQPDSHQAPTRPWVGADTSTSTDTGPSGPVPPGAGPDGTPRRRRRADAHRRRDDSLASFLKELPILLLIAFGLAFLLRTFVVQVFFIPSESMVPTLQVDDRIVVEKISYLFDGPERGDVIVFAGEEGFPTANESGIQRVARGIGQFLGVVPVDARDLVKRVIGLPGDTVVLQGGQVSVNGVALDEPYAQLDEDDGEYTVPEGQLFVLGDNRDNSADSRSSLGFVDLDNVVGRAVLKIWPLDRFGSVEGSDYAEIPTGDQGDAGAAPGGAAALGAAPVVGYVCRRDGLRPTSPCRPADRAA
jgi:signal peptidase I